MKFLTFESSSKKPICEIMENKKFKKSKTIFLDSDNECNYTFNNFKLPEGHLQLIPNPNIERQILYICGSSGSGKSYYTCQYLKQYKITFPDNEIYMFSTISDDPSLKDVKISYIKLDTLSDDELSAKDFSNSIVIFDDCDTIRNKQIKTKVIGILDDILQTGRHYKVYCVITNHTLYNGTQTKLMLAEAHSVTYFPKTAGGKAVKYLLENYLGLDKDEVKRIKKIQSRHITIIKDYPKVCLSQKEIFVLGSSDSETESESEIEEYFKHKKYKNKGSKKNKIKS